MEKIYQNKETGEWIMPGYSYEVRWDFEVYGALNNLRPRLLTPELYFKYEGWCKNNCEGKWKWHSSPKQTKTFINTVTLSWLFFELEEDAVAFKLRWA